MAAETVLVSRERLTEIIGASATAAHMQPVLAAIRDFGVGVLMIPQESGSMDEALDEATEKAVVILGDDTDRALGPAGFDEPSAKQLFRMAQAVAVVASAPPIDVYEAACLYAAAAPCLVVIVETRPEQEIAWVHFIQAANPEVAIVLSTVEAGRA